MGNAKTTAKPPESQAPKSESRHTFCLFDGRPLAKADILILALEGIQRLQEHSVVAPSVLDNVIELAHSLECDVRHLVERMLKHLVEGERVATTTPGTGGER
jgi:hypothetical protein